MKLYAPNYFYLKDYYSYLDFAKTNNIEIPSEILKNVAYFDLNKNEIHYFGTAKIGETKKLIIQHFFDKLKKQEKKNLDMEN